jgi:long-chain fatty acid transport protein
MHFPHRLLRLAPLAAALVALPAFATNGYFPHGYGLKSKGMGGVSAALAQDSLGGATNPASMVWVGTRIDLGLEMFSPRRHAERSGAGFPTLNGVVESGRHWFGVPEFGYNQMLRSDLSLGFSVYGNGGMNTSYPQGNFNCGAGPANLLCGSGPLGVDLMQIVVAPTVAYKLAPRHSVGAALLLGYQRFAAEGLHAFDNAPGFPPFTQSPGNVTNRGHDGSTGVGVRLGYFGQLTDRVSIGAGYAPKMHMSRFDRYAGLFADRGSFDIPRHYSVGAAFTPREGWTIAADWERIDYAGVPAVGNPSAAPAPLGAPDGPGFGWRDIDVYKVGVAWRMTPRWTLRAGFNHGQSPIRASDVSFNILAPGVMTSHYTGGFTHALTDDIEVTAFFMVAPRRNVTGPSLFNAVLGPGAGGNETIRMRQFSFGIGWSRRF